jgi:hypothetical protein
MTFLRQLLFPYRILTLLFTKSLISVIILGHIPYEIILHILEELLVRFHRFRIILLLLRYCIFSFTNSIYV